jgi:hypothetical protein
MKKSRPTESSSETLDRSLNQLHVLLFVDLSNFWLLA